MAAPIPTNDDVYLHRLARSLARQAALGAGAAGQRSNVPEAGSAWSLCRVRHAVDGGLVGPWWAPSTRAQRLISASAPPPRAAPTIPFHFDFFSLPQEQDTDFWRIDARAPARCSKVRVQALAGARDFWPRRVYFFILLSDDATPSRRRPQGADRREPEVRTAAPRARPI